MTNLLAGQAVPCVYGKYELLERIGSGGMAEVFRARLPGIAGFEKIVVIKRLLAHLVDDEGMVQMFVDEAKLAAQVQHKNVVQVFELDRLQLTGEFYMVMEYVAGTDLRKLLRRARKAEKRILPWLSVHAAVEVLDALIFANNLLDDSGRRRNIVHRDVSPDNIFISNQGDIKLGDFGVARDDTRPMEPLAEHIKGKIRYMAPEQFSGRPVDQRYDVFALGVVLWECLTQRPLFKGETSIETINMICYGHRLPPSQLVNDVPPELDRCVLRALEADVNKRTQSTSEMQAELLEVLSRLHRNVGPIEVRNAIEALFGDNASRSRAQSAARQVQDLVEITDDLIVREEPIEVMASRDVEDLAEISEFVELDTPITAATVRVSRDELAPAPEPIVADVPQPAVAAVSDRWPASEVSSSPSRTAPVPMPVPIGRALVDPDALVPNRWDEAHAPRRDHARDAASPDTLGAWDSTYSIINPRVRPAPPDQPVAATAEARESRSPYPAYAFPTTSSAAEFDTGDLISPERSSEPEGYPVNVEVPDIFVEEPLPWDAPPASEVPLTGSRIWEPYLGAHPFWLRSKERVEFGPCNLEDLLLMIRSRIPASAKQTVQISADRSRWMDLTRFIRLSAQDFLEEDDQLPSGATTGVLRPAGLVRLFGELAPQKPTGRLVIFHRSPTRVSRTEIHLIRGAVTHVATNDSALETPAQLLHYRVVSPQRLHECLHAVALEDRSLRDVVLSKTGVDIEQYRSRQMLARLEPLIAWDEGTYVFTRRAPDQTMPFAPSLLALLPALIHRVKSTSQLRASLAGMIDEAFDRSESFDRWLPELGLSGAQLAGLDPFGQTRTLQEALRVSLGGEKFALTMGFILLELGLLVPRAQLVWPQSLR